MPAEENDPRPVAPVRPRSEDCCKSSCDLCVFDVYNDALERYQADLRAWEARQARRDANAPTG